MKTDALFYELFRLEPQSLFDLVSLNMEGEYIFESITVKTTEKRFDGFLKRVDNQGPNVFIEFQGYDDPGIYWRLFRQVCTWYEQSDSLMPFVAIVLFIDARYVPKDCPFVNLSSPNQFFQFSLTDCLKVLGNKAGVLTVLKPLVLKEKNELMELVPKWKAEIDSLKSSEKKANLLGELLEYAILQRFPKMTLKEIKKMIQLTPLDKTVAGQELISLGIKIGKKEGKEEGKEEGIKQGELIGEIRTLQRISKLPQSIKTELAKKTLKELKAMLKQLKSEL